MKLTYLKNLKDERNFFLFSSRSLVQILFVLDRIRKNTRISLPICCELYFNLYPLRQTLWQKAGQVSGGSVKPVKQVR